MTTTMTSNVVGSNKEFALLPRLFKLFIVVSYHFYVYHTDKVQYIDVRQQDDNSEESFGRDNTFDDHLNANTPQLQLQRRRIIALLRKSPVTTVGGLVGGGFSGDRNFLIRDKKCFTFSHSSVTEFRG